MQKINIEITKAKIKAYTIELKEEAPEVSAIVGLYTANDKEITTFSLSTEKWRSGVNFDLPAEFVKPILTIAGALEVIVTRQASAAIGELSSGN